ncbi:hypothetical protein BH11CYA1_BH11CYA1_27120 [soil metagenome]
MARDLYVTVDIGERFVSPALLSWSGKENDKAARDLLSRNVGGGVLDYGLGMFTFAKAGRWALGKSPYIAPTKYMLDPHNFSIGAMTASATNRLIDYYTKSNDISRYTQ